MCNEEIEMVKHSYYCLFLLWFFYLLVASIILFVSGFLLSRAAQPYRATCSHYAPLECSFDDKECLIEQKYNFKNFDLNGQLCVPTEYKVVILIIDSLRYDFTLYDETLTEVLPYQNKLPIINDLLQKEPNKTRLFEFIADPPTTTLQRLKGLTSGTLPTFIDAGSNFGTEEINEDNVIDQLIFSKKNAVFMGDDTWMGLYPNRFLRSYPFPSFNVFDLDTVDKGVKTNLNFELKQKDWDLLIGHFLGVDHCGHRYGPLHPEMSRKLMEMNEVIHNVVNELSKNTILFVIGDHGMTMTGDHGGASDDEVKTAMFIYSTVPLISKYNSKTIIRQVDLVPTLTTILGLPIPFSNLGSIILNAIPTNLLNNLQNSEWQNLLLPLWSNLYQMVHYITEYAETKNIFEEKQIKSIRDKFLATKTSMTTVSDEKDFEKIEAEVKDIMNFVFSICEEAWSQFDHYLMSRGLILNFLTMFFVYIIVDGIPLRRLSEIFASSFIKVSYSILGIVAIIIYIMYSFHFIDNLLSPILFYTGVASIIMLTAVVVQNWEIISISWYERNKQKSWVDFVYRIILLFHAVIPLSNSFVVEESSVSFFLLVSALLVILFDNIYPNIREKKNISEKDFTSRSKWISSNTKIIVTFVIALCSLRITPYFWRCREEQSWCNLFGAHHILKSSAEFAKNYYIMTLVFLAILVIASRNWLRTCGNLKGFYPTTIFFRYVPTVMVVCTGGYWILQKMPQKQQRSAYFSQPNLFAWIVYAVASLLFISAVSKPLCIHIVPKNKQTSLKGDKSIPHLFHQIKEIFDYDRSDNNPSNVPIIYGLATVYSASFIIVSTVACLLLALLLGCASAPSIVVMYFFAAFLLLMTSVLRCNKAPNADSLLQIPNSLLLAWMLISHYFFYGTGHQPTFSNIPWEAGFVGSSGDFTNYIVPATLIIINIFGSYILMGFALPLLIVAPFTITMVLPNFLMKKRNLNFTNGEVYLYEIDDNFLGSVFVICCKYVLLHEIQVFLSMLAATIHCRHLMVWKIFAPKLIFESIAMFITLASVLAGYLFLTNVNSSVKKFIVQLNKDR